MQPNISQNSVKMQPKFSHLLKSSVLFYIHIFTFWNSNQFNKHFSKHKPITIRKFIIRMHKDFPLLILNAHFINKKKILGSSNALMSPVTIFSDRIISQHLADEGHKIINLINFPRIPSWYKPAHIFEFFFPNSFKDKNYGSALRSENHLSPFCHVSKNCQFLLWTVHFESIFRIKLQVSVKSILGLF